MTMVLSSKKDQAIGNMYRQLHQVGTCSFSATRGNIHLIHADAECNNATTHIRPFNGPLSGTTRVSWYQKKHSPIHTHQEEEEGFTQTTRSAAWELIPLWCFEPARVVRTNQASIKPESTSFSMMQPSPLLLKR